MNARPPDWNEARIGTALLRSLDQHLRGIGMCQTLPISGPLFLAAVVWAAADAGSVPSGGLLGSVAGFMRSSAEQTLGPRRAGRSLVAQRGRVLP